MKRKKSASLDWPVKRNVLFRPERFSYVRKLNRSKGCVFCLAAKNEIGFETLCVYQTKYSMVLLNKYPYNSGHLLVLPRRHCGDLLKLKKAEADDLYKCLHVALQAQQEVYRPAANNIGLNHGTAAGAGMPEHLHYHVIPRWSGDLNFFPLIAETKVVIETLEQTYEKYLGYFKVLRGR